ncbi:MAG: PEGA domain-containing protein, partial [Polyangiales bacterium]
MKRLAIATLMLFLGSVLARPALAEDLADEADVQFELGAKKYQAGDYLGALEHFLVSNRLVPNKNVLFNIARCYEQLHRFPDAYRAYERALEAETAPEGRKNLEAAIARIAPKVAILEVTTDPPGATVYLDRKDLGARGETPRKLGLEKGKYKVIVELAGHESAIGEATVEIGQETKLHLKLEPILTTLVFEGENGATVRLDSETAKPLCTLPCTAKVPPGKHVLHVSREGFKKAEIPVDLAPKTTVTVSARLDVVTGTVVVNADVLSALIEVDGKPYGFAPAVLQVPIGAHTMTVSRSGFKAVTQKIVVKQTEQTRVDATLTEVSEVTAASRSQESVEDAPSSVSIVPSVELRGMGYPTIGEAVRGVRGVYLTDDRHYLTVGFRGFSNLGDYGNRVLILVDGHPTNDDYIGSSFVGYEARTDLEDVERIEVVRGPGSVLYGTGAFFGVINLVTRSRAAPTRVDATLTEVSEVTAASRS